MRTLIIYRSLCNPSDSTATTGQNLARLTVNALESIRNNESFISFYDIILVKVKEHPSVSEPILPRKRRAPSRYEVGTSEPHYSSTARDYYRGLYFEAVNCLTSAIKERFNQPAFLVYQNLNEHERNLIDQVARISKLVHVNPSTSSTGEHSFSTARQVKTWLRSQMNQARFTHLSFLNTHKARLDKICLVSIANAFVLLNHNRKRNLGKFTEVDFH